MDISTLSDHKLDVSKTTLKFLAYQLNEFNNHIVTKTYVTSNLHYNESYYLNLLYLFDQICLACLNYSNTNKTLQQNDKNQNIIPKTHKIKHNNKKIYRKK